MLFVGLLWLDLDITVAGTPFVILMFRSKSVVVVFCKAARTRPRPNADPGLTQLGVAEA
jgi:hypothetical protein